MDHRLIVPHLEGPNGDHRKEVLVPGPRTVVAPYFVEPPRLVAAALDAAGLAAAPRSRVFLRAAGQKGARARARRRRRVQERRGRRRHPRREPLRGRL